ncbi:MAG: twin-arginine translocation signal domain-containing protein [Thermoguttaceae bacterium]|nr:twin-arginine translocation signal domain-containing protein [Thermoguttaceae bacterium]
MSLDRRDFIKTAAAGLAATTLGSLDPVAPIAFADCPDPNNPNDPNAITDPDREMGKAYGGWKEGEFDIHFIHTGATENCFMICPDGTTILLDAGEQDLTHFGQVKWNPTKSDEAACKPMPDNSRRPSEWVTRYISRLLPDLETIDYVIASHFHTDHIGHPNIGPKTTDRDPNYTISGIARVGETYRFGTAFDRGYPDYARPTEHKSGEWANLVNFFEYKEKTAGLKREKFEVGALDQIKLTRAPDKYDFHVRNLVANGVVWGGEGKENVDYFELYPKNKETNNNENTRSMGERFQYGAFRFYTGGDISGAILDENGKDVEIEGAVGRACGPVDVVKTNHHASNGAMFKSFVNEVQARVYVTCCWWKGHVNAVPCETMSDETATGYPGPRLMCPTDVHPMNLDWLKDKPWRGKLCERGGHVVVKAYDGGARYKVYYLTAKDESMNVELVFGPFESKNGQKAQLSV